MCKRKNKIGTVIRSGILMTTLSVALGTGIYAKAEDNEEPKEADITISITNPDEDWLNEKYEAEISIDVNDGSDFEIKSVSAKFGEKGESKNITETMKYEISDNGELYITVKDVNGFTYNQEFTISYFDYEGPELIGAINNGVLTLNAADSKVGVASLIINGYEYDNCPDGTLQIRLEQFDASIKEFSIFVKDKLGNLSDEYLIENPYYQEGEVKKDDDLSAYLPIDAENSAITTAVGSVIYHATDYGYAEGADPVLTEDGNVIEDYDGMEFYVIETASGKKFYMVIDKAQSDNNAYLLSEASEADLLNFTGTESLVLPKNAAVIAGAYKNEDGSDEVKYKAGEFNSSPNAIDGDEEVPVKKSNNNNMIMIGVIAVLFAAVAIMMKKKKKTGIKNDDEVLKDDSLDDLYEKEVSDDD